MEPSLPHLSLELRTVRTVMVINNKETTNHVSSVITNIIMLRMLLLHGLLSPQVWEAWSTSA